MKKYTTAKAVFELLNSVGWVFVTIGVIAPVYLILQEAYIQALAGISAVVTGFFTISFTYIGLAQVSIAENTEKIINMLSKMESIGKNNG